MPEAKIEAEAIAEAEGTTTGYVVETEEFTGPFDLLLSLVAKRKLDVTIFALAEVTDDFLAYIRQTPSLSEASEFLVIAATLLEIKSARLLPDGQALLEEDLELLEARDLLFSRLLQYRAFKEASFFIAERMQANDRFVARKVSLEKPFASLLPQLSLDIEPEDLARKAANAIFTAPPTVMVTHLHDPLVPVAQQVEIMVAMLRERPALTFREIVADAESLPVVISRFLGLLDLFKQNRVELNQAGPLGEIQITWVESDDMEPIVVEEYDSGGEDSLIAESEE